MGSFGLEKDRKSERERERERQRERERERERDTHTHRGIYWDTMNKREKTYKNSINVGEY